WRPGYHEVPVEVQKQSFRRMCSLAVEAGLPVIVHDREAHEDCLAILAEFPGLRGAMHAFSGDAALARRCLDLGLHVSVAGPVTYPNAAGLREALAEVPLERLLVETDAPFLPPQPWRGRPNRPAYVVETARRLAEVKGVALAELATAVRRGAHELFGVPAQGAAAGGRPS
ncbi:MAG TPA: TatD family hydrolase, partial [Candidatus Dormibacteraeota bacterium]|nr:TatD family hydrolase [Candidatus Dormibacteraeota bacterium]